MERKSKPNGRRNSITFAAEMITNEGYTGRFLELPAPAQKMVAGSADHHYFSGGIPVGYQRIFRPGAVHLFTVLKKRS